MKTMILLALLSQFPGQPSKTTPFAAPPAAPSKAPVALASPQADPVQASPQQTYQAPQADPVQPVVVLRAVPSIYAVQRQVVVQAAPVSYATMAYADPGCGVVQQQVVRQTVLRQQVVQHSAVVNHGVVHQAQVNHQIGAGVGRRPRKIVTKQVTKTKRGLLGGLFGG